MRGEVESTGDLASRIWILLLALLVLTLGEFIQLSDISVLICQWQRMDCKTPRLVRNLELIWPIGHKDLS